MAICAPALLKRRTVVFVLLDVQSLGERLSKVSRRSTVGSATVSLKKSLSPIVARLADTTLSPLMTTPLLSALPIESLPSTSFSTSI